LLDLNLQFFRRMHKRVALPAGQPQPAQYPSADSLKKTDGRPKYAQIPLEGSGDQQGYEPGTLQTDTLRDQLAQHDVHNRQQHKCHGERNCMHYKDGMAPRNVCDQWTQLRCESSLAKRSKSKTCECNADLHSGYDSIEVSEQVEHNACARVAFLHQLPNARKPHRDKRKLDGREESIHGHQRK
jgi:hypothetical protein